MNGPMRWAALGLLLGGLLGGVPSARAADPQALMDKGVRLYEKEKYGKALKVFLKVRNMDPDHLQARQYMDLCQEKIVEQEKGRRIRQAAKAARTSSASHEPGDELPGWAADSQNKSRSGRTRVKPTSSRPGRANPLEEPTTPGARILIKRDVLADSIRDRLLGEGAVRVESHRKRTDIILNLNRLFLPYTDTLSPDALPLLNDAAKRARERGDRTVLLRAVDTLTPAVRHGMIDLPSRRCAIVFSYFVDAVLNPRTTEALVLTPEDLED